jgi:osmotically-inducible protein OsmY
VHILKFSYFALKKIMVTPANRFASLLAIAALTLPVILSGCNSAQGMPVIAPPATVDATADDAMLTAKIKIALMAGGASSDLDIRIRTQKDEVMLSGFADSQAQIDRSIKMVKRVEGVRRVINRMSIRRFT